MDLSKVYDSVNHELIIAKLAAYQLSAGSLTSKIKKKTGGKNKFSPGRVAKNYSRSPSRVNIILFNIFINDLLLFIKETDVCNLADDITCGNVEGI